MAILVLGMHRSGTSCLTAMLVAAGARVDGPSVRNWDNARGHFEANALIRLNEDVLFASGGHWLGPPDQVTWTDEHAAERDRLLGGSGTIWKDPRTLLVLPFWSATDVPHERIGVVRHPLAVARSLLAWRGIPIDEGLRLWIAHNRALADSGVRVVGFDRPREAFVADVAAIAAQMGLVGDVAGGYAAELVHHGADGPPGDAALVAQAEALYERLGGTVGAPSAFPWPLVQACLDEVRSGRSCEALAREALQQADPTAVMAPIAAAMLHAHRGDALLRLIDEVELPDALAGLLRGKACLDAKRPRDAVRWLRAAVDVPEPLYEARHLLPVALWEAGERDAADAALADLLPYALYPFRVLARRAEWAWARKRHDDAMRFMDSAIEAAPMRRQGRLLNRRAAWKEQQGDSAGAAADRALATVRDPSFRA